MVSFELLKTGPSDNHVIHELHVWIGTFSDGNEGGMVHDRSFPAEDGTIVRRPVPLMDSDRTRAEALGPLARRCQEVSGDTPTPIIRVELRTFRAVQS